MSWRPPEDIGSEITRYVIEVLKPNDEKITECIIDVDNPVKNHYIKEVQHLPSDSKLLVTIKAARKGYFSEPIRKEISTYEESKCRVNFLFYSDMFMILYTYRVVFLCCYPLYLVF